MVTLLECDLVLSGINLPTFRETVLPNIHVTSHQWENPESVICENIIIKCLLSSGKSPGR